MYVAESAISSGTAGTSAEGAENTAAIAAGLVVFLAGTRRYRFKKLVGSPLTQIAAVVVAAWRKRRLALPADPAMLYDIDAGKLAAADEGSTKKSKRKERLPHTDQFR